MKSLLSELYLGRLQPDGCITPQDPEYRLLNRQISQMMEACKVKLSEADCMMLEELLDLYGRSHSMECEATFLYGFKMGALLMLEVIGTQEELFQD